MGIVWGAILIAEWVRGEGKRMGTHRMRKVEGTDVALVEHKNNGAISRQPMLIFKWASNYSSGCQFTARHTGAKLNLFWCYTSLCTQPMSNFTEAARWLRPWDNDAEALSSHSPSLLVLFQSFHLRPLKGEYSLGELGGGRKRREGGYKLLIMARR